jgi:uncharacterized phosphosugar-binding protein
MLFDSYIAKLQQILQRIQDEQAEAIGRAGEIVGMSIANGGVIHLFGTGHSHLIVEEAFFRAGGVVAINPILDERLVFLKGALESTRAEREDGYARALFAQQTVESYDCAILVSNSGRNAAPVEMALEMRAHGVMIVAITNLAQSSKSSSLHVSGKRLFEVADVVIDTCGTAGDAVLPIPGLEYPMGPSSTVAGAAIINSIMIEAAAWLLKRGTKVPIFPSANLPATTTETVSQLAQQYRGRVRLLDA